MPSSAGDSAEGDDHWVAYEFTALVNAPVEPEKEKAASDRPGTPPLLFPRAPLIQSAAAQARQLAMISTARPAR